MQILCVDWGSSLVIKGGVVSLQFLFSPTSHEQQKLSQEFIEQERVGRQYDVVMVVEDDLFSRNIATNALKNKFKVVEVMDGGKAVQEYLSHSSGYSVFGYSFTKQKGISNFRRNNGVRSKGICCNVKCGCG